jgi:hypothetical protein
MFFSGFDDNDTCSNETYLSRLRHWRDRQLAASDWTQVADAPVDKAAWATYRQALRDLPASNTNPRLIEAPAQPGGN